MDSPAIDQILARYYNVPVLPIPSTVSPGGGESIVPSQSNNNLNTKSKTKSESESESTESMTVNLEENVIIKPEFKTPKPKSKVPGDVEQISDEESEPSQLDTTFSDSPKPCPTATPGRTRQSRQQKPSRLQSPQPVRRPRGGSSGKSHENCSTPPQSRALPQRVIRTKGKTPGSKVPKAVGGKGK